MGEKPLTKIEFSLKSSCKNSTCEDRLMWIFVLFWCELENHFDIKSILKISSVIIPHIIAYKIIFSLQNVNFENFLKLTWKILRFSTSYAWLVQLILLCA